MLFVGKKNAQHQQASQWSTSLEEEVEDGDGCSEARPESLAESWHVEVARHEDEGDDDVDDGDGLGRLDHVADAAAAARHADTHREDPFLHTELKQLCQSRSIRHWTAH